MSEIIEKEKEKKPTEDRILERQKRQRKYGHKVVSI